MFVKQPKLFFTGTLLRLALLVCGTRLSISPVLAQSVETQAAGIKPMSYSVLLAQRNHDREHTPIFCGKQKVFFEAETANYWVNICGKHKPEIYIGVNKTNSRKTIRIPLSNYDAGNNYYEAVYKNYTYIISNTPRGRFLTVSKGDRELLREPLSDFSQAAE